LKLKDLTELLGFTRTEISVLFFLIIIFFGGFLIRLLNADKLEFSNYDYSLSDSLFLSSPDENDQSMYSDNNIDNQKKELEVNTAVYKKNKSSLPSEKSIDLNTATLAELMELPGIGQITAEKIISLRNEKGGFETIDEIKEVKGIENKKFERIKKYIFIEN